MHCVDKSIWETLSLLHCNHHARNGPARDCVFRVRLFRFRAILQAVRMPKNRNISSPVLFSFQYRLMSQHSCRRPRKTRTRCCHPGWHAKCCKSSPTRGRLRASPDGVQAVFAFPYLTLIDGGKHVFECNHETFVVCRWSHYCMPCSVGRFTTSRGRGEPEKLGHADGQ
jgi:hypothetical protein